jgi:MFS family permease
MRIKQDIFFGWRVVGAAFTVAIFAWGIGFYGPPIFLEVLHATRGWPLGLVATAITLHFLLGAAVVANLGRLHRRFGVAAVTRAGALMTALGLLGWAFAREPWQLFLATPLSGAGWAFTSGAALNAMVSPWFIRRRPAALGMAFNGASMGGVVFSPLWVALITQLGFGVAALLVASVAAVVVWILADRYLSRDPQQMGLAPDGLAAAADSVCSAAQVPVDKAQMPIPQVSVDKTHVPIAQVPIDKRQAPVDKAPLARPWQDRRFVTLAAAAALGLFAQIGLVAHLFSVLTPTLGAGGAGAAMGAATACAIGGRTLLGRLMPPHADRRMVAAANVALQAMGSIVLLCAGTSAPWLLLGCGLFGLGLGNVTSLPPLIAQSEFNPADVPRVVALVTALGQAGYAFAPAVFGLLRDPAGTASWTRTGLLFMAAAAIQLAAAAVIVLGRQTVSGTKSRWRIRLRS